MSNAKIAHTEKILAYLADWDNPWPKTDRAMGKIVGITPQGIQRHFSPAELRKLRDDGLELRKQNSSAPRAAIYDSMAAIAAKGNTTAQKEFLDRTEGKITDRQEHVITGEINITTSIPEPKKPPGENGKNR